MNEHLRWLWSRTWTYLLFAAAVTGIVNVDMFDGWFRSLWLAISTVALIEGVRRISTEREER